MPTDQPEPTSDEDWLGPSWTWVPGDQDDTAQFRPHQVVERSVIATTDHPAS